MIILFRNKISIFFAKRVIVLFILLAIITLIFIQERWFALAGLSIGTFFGIVRFDSNARSLLKPIPNISKRTIKKRIYIGLLIMIIGRLLILPLLFITFKIDEILFFGTTIGLLLVNFTLVINSFTETLGITNNHFE